MKAKKSFKQKTTYPSLTIFTTCSKSHKASPTLQICLQSLTNHTWCTCATINPVIWVKTHFSESDILWSEVSTCAYWHWSRSLKCDRGATNSWLYLDLSNTEKNASFDLRARQILYRISCNIPASKLLFASTAKTKGKEFQQCPRMIDSFPLSSCHLKWDTFETDCVIWVGGHCYIIFTAWCKKSSVSLSTVKTKDQDPLGWKGTHLFFPKSALDV